jgi:hypothetical protein
VDINKANPGGVKNNVVASGSANPPFSLQQPSQSAAGSDATSWQYAQNYDIAWPGGRLRADLSTSIYPDPGRGILGVL